jgi:hypothetical protein
VNACHVIDTYFSRNLKFSGSSRAKEERGFIVGSKDESTVSGNQLLHRKHAGRHLTEIFLGETMNKSGASYDGVN